MKNKILLLILSLQLSAVALHAQSKPLLFGQNERKIFVNNRILAKVNGKPISVVDVMKKMDMLFYRQYPQYAGSAEARYEFYSMYWKNALQECIDKELIMADAQEVKIEVSNGDARQEMERLFGPNIIANLDAAGLTYDEAMQMLSEDIKIKRTLGGRVNAVALRMVTPQAVQTAYDEYVKNSSKPDEWGYQVISIRSEDPAEGEAVAKKAYELLTNQKVPLITLVETLNPDEKTTVKVSEEFRHAPKDVSKEYNASLSALKAGEYSEPTSQISRVGKSTVYRIFYLKEIFHTDVKTFAEVENRLRDKLIDMMITKETDKYLDKLRKHYNISEEHLKVMFPDDFEPFILK